MESELSTGGDKEEHLYEPLPEHTSSQSDPHKQKTSVIPNPSTVGEPYKPLHHPWKDDCWLA